MEILNEQATSIFKMLVAKLIKQEHIKIMNDPYMPLSFEIIGRVNTYLGDGWLYSLMHYYSQNGDLMRDPEMCFMSVKQAGEYQVYPYSYQLDGLGLYQESMSFIGGGEIEANINLQGKHTSFANDWLIAIKSQGYLK